MSKVEVHLPSRPKGDEIEVMHLGLFPNGATSDVTDEQKANWCAQTGQDWPKGGTLKVPDTTVSETVIIPGAAEATGQDEDTPVDKKATGAAKKEG